MNKGNNDQTSIIKEMALVWFFGDEINKCITKRNLLEHCNKNRGNCNQLRKDVEKCKLIFELLDYKV
jgi:hypothetical protein